MIDMKNFQERALGQGVILSQIKYKMVDLEDVF